MRTSEQIGELAVALSLAQASIESAHKDSANPFFNSRYADLASVWDACRGPLTANGLSVVQIPSADGQVVTVESRLLHKSGQWIEGTLTSAAKDDGPQSIGSAITYLRRYALQALVGVAPEDDDGNEGQGPEPDRSPRREDSAPRGRQPQGGGENRSQGGGRGRQQQEPIPEVCPKCGASAVHRKRGGGFCCWKSEGGCEHEWVTPQDIAATTPGVTTGDKVPPPATGELLPPEKPKSVHALAVESIEQAISLRDLDMIRKIEERIKERALENKLTDREYVDLGNKIADAEAAIKAVVG